MFADVLDDLERDRRTGGDPLAVELHSLHEQRCRLDRQVADVVNRYEADCREALFPPDSVGWLTRVSSTSRYQANRQVTVARAVAAIPELGDALESARIGFEHAYRIAVLATAKDSADAIAANQAGLIAQAQAMPADRFRRWLEEWDRRRRPDDGAERDEAQHRQRDLRSWKNDDGMTEGRFCLDPLDSRLVTGVLQGIVDEQRQYEEGHPLTGGADRTAGQRRADALVEACRRALGADAATGRRARPTVGVLTTYDDLVEDLYGGTDSCELDDGTPISATTARRLACEADIVPIVLGGDGMPLDVGRKYRVATWTQRIALRARYATCAWGDCNVPFDWCEIHHIWPWELHGPTDLDNLIPLCKHHHDTAHLGGVYLWPVERHADGRLTDHRPGHKPRITIHPTPRPGEPRRPDVRLN